MDLGRPALLKFSGPDAVRFLNGQLTQDVKLATLEHTLPSCVTDAKGKLQFRVYLTKAADGALLISAPEGSAEALEGRLTKYLIADDVEVEDLSGKYRLFHLIGAAVPAEGNAFARKASRYGVEGVDFWVPEEETMVFPEGLEPASGEEVEAFRISHGAPAWGKDLTEGMLPPEAALESTDISYHKGCYIGQEVISRIRTAGKVNRSLVSLTVAEDVREGALLISDESEAGVVTSVSPIAEEGRRAALGYLKRSANRGDLKAKVGDDLRQVDLRCGS